MINAQPLVSVLIATYNQKDVVGETLQSVALQSYRNIEIIISDDSSTDGTPEVLREFAARNSNVRLYLQKENLGITKNYNFLASMARGGFVSIFSGDDIMVPSKIERQVEVLRNSVDASYCHHAVYDMEYRTNKIRRIISYAYVDSVTTIDAVLRNMGVPGSMSVMYRKSMAPSPAFDPRIKTASDWLNIIHLTARGRGIYLDEPLCYYRRDDGYNQKDPTRYERDFVDTIEIARATYACNDAGIGRACDYALSRFFLGAGYRRLIRGDISVARDFFLRATGDPKLRVGGLFFTALSYFPFAREMCSAIVRVYKRYF
jgi:glycosyltransferase involved in cell wall biosynthesis